MRKISLWLAFLLVLTFNFSEWIPLGQPSTFNCIFAAERIIDDFKDVEVWSDNQDGGTAPEFSLSKEYARDSKNSLKLVYTNPANGWGNIKKETTMTGKEKTVDFWLYKESSNEKAAMQIYLYEEDRDLWIIGVTENGKIVGAMETGWHKISLPVEKFRLHRAGGDGEREISSVNKIILGCNYGDMVVYISGLKFDAVAGQSIVPAVKSEEEPKVGSLEEPKKAFLIKRTSKGAVGIFRDKVPLKDSIASSPEFLGELLKKAGYGIAYLNTEDLSDPGALNKDNIDILVLPYGSSFPVKAINTFKSFLKKGGSFFSTGGAAFDNLYPEPEKPVHLNTRRLIGDHHMVGYPAGLISIFDSPNKFENASKVIASENQFVAPKDFSVKIALNGHSSSALIADAPVLVMGKETAKWVPILDGLDEAGNLKARIGGMVYHYGGTYKNSRWAFFGVTNFDLFKENSPFCEIFVRTINRIMQGVFSFGIKTDFMSYRQGEKVNASVSIRNPSNFAFNNLKGTWTITDLDEKQIYTASETMVVLNPGEISNLEFIWAPDKFDRDFYKVRFDLLIGGEIVDRIETGFVVWNPNVFKEFQVSFKDAMFHINGVESFLLGTCTTGGIFSSVSVESPLVWQNDFSWMRDNGLSIFRIMHFTILFDNVKNLSNVPEVYLRKLDAILQIAAKNRVIIFLAAHSPWGAQKFPIEQEGELLEVLGRRYREVTSLAFDTDHHQKRVTIPEVWIKINKDGLRKAQSNAPLAQQFNMLPLVSVETMLNGDVDILSYMWYSTDIPVSKWLKERDYRIFGKSISFSEFGRSIDRRITTSGELSEVNSVFHDWVHSAFVCGVNSMLNWTQRDTQRAIFPWGFFYNDGVAQPHFWPFRNMGIFLKTLQLNRGNPPACLVTKEGKTLLSDSFESNLEGWRPMHEMKKGVEIQQVKDKARSGKGSLSILVPEDVPITWYDSSYKIEGVKEGEIYKASVYIKTENMREGHGAYTAFNYFREDGSRISFTNSSPFIKGTTEWTKIEALGTIPQETAYIYFTLVIHGRGQAWFDDVTIKKEGADISKFLSANGNFAIISENYLSYLPSWVQILMYEAPISKEHQKSLEGFLSKGGILYIYGEKHTRLPFALMDGKVISQKVGGRKIDFTVGNVSNGKVILDPYPAEDRESKVEGLRLAFKFTGKNLSYIPADNLESISEWHSLFSTEGGCVDIVKAKKDGKILLKRKEGNEVLINVQRDRWVAVHWNPADEIQGIEAGGNVVLKGKDILFTTVHYMISSLDKLGLNKSAEILFLPMSSGKVSFQNDFINIALAGSIKNGRWLTEAELAVTRKGDVISFEIPSKYQEKLFLLLSDKKKESAFRDIEKFF